MGAAASSPSLSISYFPISLPSAPPPPPPPPQTSSLTDFVFNYNDGGDTIRGVCGTSPRVCTDPRPGLNSDIWVEDNILTWPVSCSHVTRSCDYSIMSCDQPLLPQICLDTNINTSDSSVDAHLTCDITGRPCCVSIQALCIITTREHCDFLSGRFHQEAFLCSQVESHDLVT